VYCKWIGLPQACLAHLIRDAKGLSLSMNVDIVPEIGNDQFREIIYGNYRIIYRVEKKQESIMTIRHGNQILPIDELLA